MDDGTVFRFAEDHLWVCTNSDEREEYFGAASKGLDVQVRYIAPELPSMQIQGPKSRELMQHDHGCGPGRAPLLPFPPGAGAGRWRARVALPDGVQRRAGVRGLPRVRSTPRPSGRRSKAPARPPTAPMSIEPIRVEVGMIVTDYDYEPHQRTPFDLGLDRFVSLNELNMGTEKLRAVAAAPPNRFVTVRLEGDELPEYGSAMTDGGETVGVLTSPADSPRFGPIGLAVLRTDLAVPGTRVSIEHGDGTMTGTVDVLAIYDPAKERPRA